MDNIGYYQTNQIEKLDSTNIVPPEAIDNYEAASSHYNADDLFLPDFDSAYYTDDLLCDKAAPYDETPFEDIPSFEDDLCSDIYQYDDDISEYIEPAYYDDIPCYDNELTADEYLWEWEENIDNEIRPADDTSLGTDVTNQSNPYGYYPPEVTACDLLSSVKETKATAAHTLLRLFVQNSDFYLQQETDGSYPKRKKLTSGILRDHIDGIVTVGVYDSGTTAKYICFDIDYKADITLAQQTVTAIISKMVEYGFPRDKIYCSYSGNKGYHVEVYIDKQTNIRQIHMMQICILLEVRDEYHPALSCVNVDLRPQENHGLKLPLGIHQVTGERCWYVDTNTFEPIEDFHYILDVKPISLDSFNEIYDSLCKRNCRTKIMQRAERESGSKLTVSRKRDTYSDNRTIDDLLNSISITEPHTRHNKTFELGIKLRSAGVANSNECYELLMRWTKMQNQSLISSNTVEIKRENRYISCYLFKNPTCNTLAEYNHNSTVCVTRRQMYLILSLRDKSPKLLMFYMLTHILSTTDMIYQHALDSIHKETGLSNISKLLDTLSDDGYIIKHHNECDKTKYIYQLYGNAANSYSLGSIFDSSLDETFIDPDKTTAVYVNNSDLEKAFSDALSALFSKEELKKFLPRRQREYFFGKKEKNQEKATSDKAISESQAL